MQSVPVMIANASEVNVFVTDEAADCYWRMVALFGQEMATISLVAVFKQDAWVIDAAADKRADPQGLSVRVGRSRAISFGEALSIILERFLRSVHPDRLLHKWLQLTPEEAG